MSSRPILARLEAAINAMPEGEDTVFDRIAEGEKVGRIMAECGASRTMFWQWLNHGVHKERRAEKYAAAKKASAEAIFDEGGKILDDLAELSPRELMPAAVSLASKRADWRRHMAAVRDPETYGEKQGPTVNISIASLHLDALRLASARPALPQPEPLTLEAELVQ